MVKSSEEFKDGCIPMHWQMPGWCEDLRPPLDTLQSATAVHG